MYKKIKLSLVAVILVVTGMGFYLTPHLSVYNLKKAADNKDSEALSNYVDYPSLRESLKANFNAKMASDVAKSNGRNPFKALGAVFAKVLVNPMIDAFVTPESIAMLLKGKKLYINKSGSISKRTNSSSEESNTDISMSYRGFNRFVVKFKGKDSSEDPVALIFKREGLISWKLSALRIP